MFIKQTQDIERAKDIRRRIKENGGYCPCAVEQNEDTKCMCKVFREMRAGTCPCGLYIKEDI